MYRQLTTLLTILAACSASHASVFDDFEDGDYHKASGGQTDPALHSWIADLPKSIAVRLGKIGVLDPQRAGLSKTLPEHADEFEQALLAKGTTAKHTSLVVGRVRRVVKACRFQYWSDLTPSRLMNHLSELREDAVDEQGDIKRGVSAQTFNFYLQAMKQFCRWAVKERRISESPVAHLQGLNVKTDRRVERRALRDEELQLLLTTTRQSDERLGMTGPDRALLYLLGVETGLRAGELRSLTTDSFELNCDPPTVKVAAAYSKRRREDVIPLRPGLARQLRDRLRGLAPATPFFQMPEKTARMFREDLDVARSKWISDAPDEEQRKLRGQSALLKPQTPEGLADFHALRHTFITNLARSGVHPKLAQDLARHSDINLTL